MSKTGLRVVVDRYDIIITQPGSNFMAVYFKPPGQPYLVAKDPPIGSREFSERAWEMANAKARELGWIAGPPISKSYHGYRKSDLCLSRAARYIAPLVMDPPSIPTCSPKGT